MPATREPVDMDQAQEAAAQALKSLEAKPELKAGIAATRAWWAEHYLTPGHKRLARSLLGKKAKEEA